MFWAKTKTKESWRIFSGYFFLMFRLSLSFKEVFGFSVRCSWQTPVNPSVSTTHRCVATGSWCGRGGGGEGKVAFRLSLIMGMITDRVRRQEVLRSFILNNNTFSFLRLETSCCTWVYTSDTRCITDSILHGTLSFSLYLYFVAMSMV